MKHTYLVNCVTNKTEDVRITYLETSNKKQAIAEMKRRAAREREHADAWRSDIFEVSIEVEDETGKTVAIEQAFDREEASK